MARSIGELGESTFRTLCDEEGLIYNRSSENDSIIENLGFSILRYDRFGFYVIVVNKEDIESKHSEIKQLIKMAKVNLHGE